jgi:hypothetical protein
MTVLVRQRMDTDCGPACLAMLTARTLDEVIEMIGDAWDPVKGLRSEARALTRLGFAEGSFIHLHNDWCITSEFFRRFAWKRRALVCVPSKNMPGKWHLIYFDGKDVFDPSPKLTYARFEELQPVELVLFDEAAVS